MRPGCNSLTCALYYAMARDETTKVIVSEFNKVINAFMGKSEKVEYRT